jgi:hypothetical protein
VDDYDFGYNEYADADYYDGDAERFEANEVYNDLAYEYADDDAYEYDDGDDGYYDQEW